MKRVAIVMMVLLVAVSAGAWEFTSFETSQGMPGRMAALDAQEFWGTPLAPKLGIMYGSLIGYQIIVDSGGPDLSPEHGIVIAMFDLEGQVSPWPMSIQKQRQAVLSMPSAFLSMVQPDLLGITLIGADGTQIGAVWDVSAIAVVLAALKAR